MQSSQNPQFVRDVNRGGNGPSLLLPRESAAARTKATIFKISKPSATYHCASHMLSYELLKKLVRGPSRWAGAQSFVDQSTPVVTTSPASPLEKPLDADADDGIEAVVPTPRGVRNAGTTFRAATPVTTP